MSFSLPMFYITAWTTYGPNQRRDHRSPQAADVRPSLSPRLGCGDHAENVCRPCDGPSLEDTDGIGVYSRRRRSHGGLTSSRRSGGFDKGRWPVRWLGDRAGFWPAPVSPIWAIARVPLSIRRGRWNPWAAAARRYFYLSRQPTGVGAAAAGAPAGVAACAPWRRRERPSEADPSRIK
jgi:hypothetical protein